MHRKYHIQLTTEVLEARVSPPALKVILRANLGQDSLFGLLGHPEYHFDDNAFPAGRAYLEAQREQLRRAIASRRDPAPAWKAFGRLSHAAQDFYAHSNYVSLWAERFSGGNLPPPETIEPLEASLLNHTALRSGRVYYPLEALTLVPGLKGLVRRWLPRDSHAWMNLDGPECGPLFAYALVAARRRTRHEFDRINRDLHKSMGASAVRFFSGQRP
jgi:hypothetical protein